QARDDIGRSARRERHDDAHRPRGIALRGHRLRQEARGPGEQHGGKSCTIEHGSLLVRWAILGYSTRAPEALTTRAIFAKSARSSALNTPGVSAFGSMPCFARRSRITGSLSRVPTAELILSTVETGISAGPSKPSQESNS